MNASVSYGASPVSSLPDASTPVESPVARKSAWRSQKKVESVDQFSIQKPKGFSNLIRHSSFIIAASSLTANSIFVVQADRLSIQACSAREFYCG